MGLTKMTQPLLLDGVTAQQIFDDNVSDLKLSWIGGLEGAERTFPPEAVKALGNFPELGRKASQSIPQAKLVAIDQAGHVPHVEVPEVFNQAVIEFLNTAKP
jgi:hypothetical protein